MKGQRGFSLIETVVAIVLFSIVMLFAVSLFTYARVNREVARRRDFALELASKKMEEYQATSYTLLTSSSPAGILDDKGISYTLTVTTAAHFGSFPYNEFDIKQKEIRVDVVWPNVVDGNMSRTRGNWLYIYAKRSPDFK